MDLRTQLSLELSADYKSERPGMSKRIKATILILAALGTLGAVFLAATGNAAAPIPQRAGTAANSTRNAAIVATTLAILRETSEIRELSILRPVKSGAQSRTEIERMVVRNLEEQTTPAQMHATEVSLKRLGLVPNDFQYRSFIIKLLTEQVAGYYDPKVQQFYLADWIELEGQKPVMAHELTHALQDQHFNLRRFEEWPKGDADAELAVHALIEGDATLAMSLYMAKNPLVALAFMRSLGATASSSEQFKQAPRALRESLVFPYQEGAEWATQLYKKGGWTTVSEAFTKLPQSTEQILHPEKYFAHEAPIKISLPDVRNLLGPAWKRLDYDVNGEWSYYLILDEFLQASAESRRAAAGWAGDRYEIYEGPKPGDSFLAQMTAWDTESEAREFFDAYAKRTSRRYPGATATEITPTPKDDTVSTGGSGQSERHAWQTSEGAVIVELKGSRVLILEGIPESANAKSLLRTLWQ